MNLANLGKAGLLVAQNRLDTTGHNINNAATDGYSRQTVQAQTAGATPTSAGWIGRGVQAVSVTRSYDDFLYSQLVGSQIRGASLTTYGNQIAQINNLLADPTVGISPAIQRFFDAMEAVATAPADVAARQELLGQANSLASQVRDANAFLAGQRADVNTQISTTVTQINSMLERVQDLNRQIAIAKASNPGQPPNDLFDQRDQLVADLGQLVGVQVYEQDDQVNLTVGNGQVVLGGNTVFPLQALPSKADPSRLAVNFTTTGADGRPMPVEMDDALISGGQLGGLLSFRSDVLDSTQNDLGRLAVGLAGAVNAVHEAGFDLTGTAGQAFFGIDAQAKVISAAGNTALSEQPTVVVQQLTQLTNQDYRLDYNGISYSVTRVPDGVVVSPDADGLYDGLAIDTTALVSSQAGDSWLIQPTRDAAASLTVKLSDPARVAAAGALLDADGNPVLNGTDPVAAGPADGQTALRLAALRSDKVLGNGSMSLNEAYSQLVNHVAVKTQANSTAQAAQQSLIAQNFAAQQAVSGVNLDEEYINLQAAQEQYRAAARLIDTASTLFDTLLALRN